MGVCTQIVGDKHLEIATKLIFIARLEHHFTLHLNLKTIYIYHKIVTEIEEIALAGETSISKTHISCYVFRNYSMSDMIRS